jgi:DNA-binding LytR/AlgR family response regulator
MIKILIVEDELIIAQDMIDILEKMGYEVMDNAMDAQETFEILEKNTPDLILLDINLSGRRDGIDIAKEINEKYKIPFIFTTSYTDGATIDRAKEVRPLNYLVKPFKPEQLYTAIEIAMNNLSKEQNKILPIAEEQSEEEGLVLKDALFIKDKYRYTKLMLNDILWIKADGNYLELHTSKKREVIRATLNNFLLKLQNSNFFRTHKSYAVNLDYLTSFEPTIVTILDTEIPITKQYSDELVKRLNVV